jgi:hypothetical protein
MAKDEKVATVVATVVRNADGKLELRWAGPWTPEDVAGLLESLAFDMRFAVKFQEFWLPSEKTQ